MLTSRMTWLVLAIVAASACSRDQEVTERPSHVELRKPVRIPVPLHGSEPHIGPARAPVGVVVFVDYACPAAAAAMDIIDELRNQHGDDVAIRVKPLPFQLGLSLTSARAACAADLQGEFLAMHRRLTKELAGRAGGLTRDAVATIAAELDLDVERFLSDLDSRACTERVRRDMDAARTARVRDTPTVFVNGLRASGASVASRVAAIVDDELRTARARTVALSER